jgi:hypothetical protein
MDFHNAATYIRGAWFAVGPLVGVLIGGYITNRTQKRQWILDSKRTEYRELISAVADATGKLLLYYGPTVNVLNHHEQRDAWETVRSMLGIIDNRLFIANVVKELNIQHRWEEGLDALMVRHELSSFGNCTESIIEDIRDKALKEFT